MKSSTSNPKFTAQTCDSGRRSLFMAAAAMTGLALLPRALRAAAAGAQEPVVRLARVDEDGRLAPARGVRVASGAYRLGVRGADAGMPFALEARYGDSHVHHFWQAWREPGGDMAQSHGIALTCPARSSGLPLSVRVNGQSVALDVPADTGTYLLAVAAQGHGTIAFERYRLHEPAGDCRSHALICADTQVPAAFSYVVLTVEPLAA